MTSMMSGSFSMGVLSVWCYTAETDRMEGRPFSLAFWLHIYPGTVKGPICALEKDVIS